MKGSRTKEAKEDEASDGGSDGGYGSGGDRISASELAQHASEAVMSGACHLHVDNAKAGYPLEEDMVVQMAIVQWRYVRISSEHFHQRALALGVSVALCLASCKDRARPAELDQVKRETPSARSVEHGKPAVSAAHAPDAETKPAPTLEASLEGPMKRPLIAVLSEGVLSLYDIQAKQIETWTPSDISSPKLWCWNNNVLLLSVGSLGKLDASGSQRGITWSKLTATPQGCLNPDLQIRDVSASDSGGLCVTLTDGFADTSNCEQTFTLDPTTGRHIAGCQIAELSSSSAIVNSPSGRYQAEFGDPTLGDEQYYRSAHLVDRQSKHALKLDSLNLLERDANVTWLQDERAVVLAGRLISLPELKVVVAGDAACVVH